MHIAELNFLIFVIEYLGEINTEFEILKPVYQGPRWVRIMKKTKVENLVTHSLQTTKSRKRRDNVLKWDSVTKCSTTIEIAEIFLEMVPKIK